jgi:dihydroorotate dehydrogenase (NAD+) catalytic subunit
MLNLSARVGSLVLKNPIILASGTCGYGEAYKDFYAPQRLGAVVTKGISLKPRAGNPPPRIYETPAGMLNSIGLENIGLKKFVSEKLPWLIRHRVQVVVNIFGEQEDEYVELAKRLDGEPGIAGLELNLSCPNVQKGGIEFGRDRAAVESITSRVKAVSRLPVWVKLSANRCDPVVLAQAAASAGADAVVLGNTLRGMAVELDKKRPALASVTGGLSGPALKPVALAAVHDTVCTVKIPVVACGGVFSGRDALEFLLVGARAVEVGTAALVNPLAPMTMVEEIKNYLTGLKVKSLDEWVGSLNRNG